MRLPLYFRALGVRRLAVVLVAVSLVVCLWPRPAGGAVQTPASSGPPTSAPGYAADRILVQPKRGTSLEALARFHAAQQGKVLRTFDGIGRLQIISVPAGETVPGFVARYQQSGLVEFAEPDYLGHVAAIPNDPYYANGKLWGLNKIDAPPAWDVLTSASNILVAVGFLITPTPSPQTWRGGSTAQSLRLKITANVAEPA